MAEGLSRSRRAARATLPSLSSTSRVTSRLRSGVAMAAAILAFGYMASNARIECKACIFCNSPQQASSRTGVQGAETDDPSTRRRDRRGCGLDTFGVLGARRPVAVDAAVLARHQH